MEFYNLENLCKPVNAELLLLFLLFQSCGQLHYDATMASGENAHVKSLL